MTVAQILPKFSRIHTTVLYLMLGLLAMASGLRAAQRPAQHKAQFQREKTLSMEPVGAGAMAFSAQQARPTAMVAADFDVDGVKDLAVGYGLNKGGEIAVLRGNLDAIAPQSEQSWRNAGLGIYADAFLPKAEMIPVPVTPDFIVAADANGDGYADLIFAAKNGNTFYVLAGNGKGQFTLLKPVTVEGTITALAAYMPTGGGSAEALVLGVKTSRGYATDLYRMERDAFELKAGYAMPGAVTAIATANLDSDLTPDAAIIAAGQVLVLHGAGALTSKARLETLPISDAIALTTGAFLFDRHAGLQLAVLTSDGAAHFLAHAGFDPRPFTAQEITAARRSAMRHENGPSLAQIAGNTGDAPWTEVETQSGIAPAGFSGKIPVLLRAHTSGSGGDDLLTVNGAQQEIAVVRHPANPAGALPAGMGIVTRSVIDSGDVVTAIAQRVSPRGGEGLVMLKRGLPQPEIVTPASGNTLYVNSFTDTLDTNDAARCTSGSSEACSLRDAVTYADQDATDNIPDGTSDTIMIPAGTYDLTYQAGTTDTNNNAITHLEILGPMTLMGDPSGATIDAQSNDVVFSINPGAYGSYNPSGNSYVFDTVFENLTITGGQNFNNPANSSTGTANNVGGAINWDADGTGNLTLTNCTVSSSTNGWGDGGGIWFFNSAGGGTGTLTLSGSTVSSNSTSEQGGGIYQATSPAGFSATNTTFSTNTASPTVNSSDPGGASGADDGGAIYLTAIPSASGIPSATITAGTISGNSADGDGGAIYTTQGITINGGSDIANNSATGSGGGIFHNADATTTVTAANIVSNSATNTGGGITVGTELASNGNAFTIANSRIFGNTSTNGASGLSVGEPSSTGAGAVTATENWWGCNAGPATAADGCDQATLYDSTNGSMSVSPNIVLTIAANPSSIPAGSSISLTAAVNTDSNSGSVSGGPGALQGLTVDFSATVGAFSASPTALIDGTGVATASITPSSNGAGTASATLDNQTVSTNISVTAGAATHFVITGPNPAPWYTDFNITVTAYDAGNNVATSYNGTVTFTSNDPGFSFNGPLTLTNGVGTEEIVFRTAGNDSVTATDTADPSLSGTAFFTVPPGPASQLIVTAPASTNAGATFNVTVGAYDLYGNVATGYTGTVVFSSTDPAAALPASYTFGAADNGIHVFPATLNTAGSQTITATDTTNSTITGTSGTIAVTISSFVVNTSADDAPLGTASNCPANPTTTGAGACTLRDALAAATAAGSGNITFDPTVFTSTNSAAQNTITLTTGLTASSDTTITGPTSGSGATLTNLVTINGGGGSVSLFPILVTNSNAVVSIQNLIITKAASASANGGAIDNGYQAVLTIQNCTISRNSSTTGASAIFNDYNASVAIIGSTISNNTGNYGAIVSESGGSVTVTDSTITGNSTGNPGGAILSDGTLTVTDSTITGNNASTAGGIENYGSTATLNNTILAGNTDTTGTPDGNGTFAGSDNLIGDGSGISGITNGANGNMVGTTASPINPMLAALGSYGGPTQTMLPQPGSAAICAGSSSLVPSSATTDQRGVAFNAGGYCAAGVVDEGAVQTDYSLAFSTNPSPSVVLQTSFDAAVTVSENGSPVSVSGVSIPLTLNASAGTLSGGSGTTTNGVATYSALQVSAAGLNDTLTATMVPGGGSTSTTATSSQFNVVSPLAPTISISFNPSIVGPGGTSTLTVTLGNPNTATTLTNVQMSDTLPAGLTGQYPQSVTCAVSSMSGPGFTDLTTVQPSLSPGQTCTAKFVVQAGSSAPITYTDVASVTADQWSGVAPTADATLTVPAPTQFSLSTPANATGGTAFNFTVTALDASNSVVPTYNGTVHFTSSDPAASLPVDYTFTTADSGRHTFSATLATPGNQTITATDTATAGLTGASNTIAVSAPSFVVTNTNDSGAGSLRVALGNAAAAGSGNITFDPTVFSASNTAAQNTIFLSSGLTIPANTSIIGATTGSGATLTNLVTIDGGGSANNFSIFTVNFGVAGAAISDLTIADGNVTSEGGALSDNGSIALTNCTFANNRALGYAPGGNGNGGGAIFVGSNAVTLTIAGSTFTGNSAAPGGAIAVTAGNVNISDSTFYGNTAIAGYPYGGAIFVSNNAPPTVTITSSTFSGNTATGDAAVINFGVLNVFNTIMAGDNGGECGVGGSGNDCPTNGSNGNIIGVSAIGLAPLGNYGGPTQTAIPLPGSPAICAGLAADIPVGTTSDQRGLPDTNPNYPGYNAATPCVDAGAVQTNYSMAFTTNPIATVPAGINFGAAVTVEENGNPFVVTATPQPSIPVALSLNGSGSLTGGSGSVAASTGIATFSGLQVSQPGNNDTLTATLSLNPALAPALSLTATSTSFDVAQSSTTTTASNALATYSASAQIVSLTATVSSSGGTINAGTVTFTVLNGGVPIGVATTSGTVTNGTASVSYALPGGTAPGSYTIQATYSGSGQFLGSSDNTHTLTIIAASTITAASNATATYNPNTAQSITLSATVSSTAGAVNEGTVTFTVLNGGTQVGSSVSGTVAAGTAVATYTLPAGTTAGSYTIQAVYVDGAGNLQSSTDTSHTLTVSPIPSFVVSTTADDATGVPANCPAGGGGTSCTLRDALAAAVAAAGGNITFAPSVFAAANSAAQNTITLINGALAIPDNTTVTGPSSFTVTIDGNQNGNIFEIAAGATVAVSNLTLQNALGTGSQLGGAVYNAGTLALTGVTILNSQPSLYSGGGGIYNDSTGTLTLNGCTIGNNGSSYFGGSSGSGGGIFNSSGNLTVIASTLSVNAASNSGGNIYTDGGTVLIANSTITGSDGTLNGGGLAVAGGGVTVIDSTIAFNNAGANPGVLIGAGTVTVTNSIVAANGSPASTGNCTGCTLTGKNVVDVDPQLSVLGSYGGATQTFVPLPGSPAICSGAATAYATDQRGYARPSGACYDIGAAQTKYAIAFVQQPTNSIVDAVISPAVTVSILDHGNGIPGALVNLTLNGNGQLNGTIPEATDTSGTATFADLSVSAAGTNDTLTAISGTFTTTSNSFNVQQIVPTFSFTPAPNTQVYGTAIAAGSLDATASYNGNPVAGTFAYSATVNGGLQTLTAGTTVMPAGTYTIQATFTPANSAVYTGGTITAGYSVTQAVPTVTWNAPAAITYGTALSATQLDATATFNNAPLAGTFVYSPATGAVLSAGLHTLSVSFTPSDTTDFSTPNPVTTTITVNDASLFVTANNATKVYGTANPTFTGSVTGAVNNDTFTESFATAATTSSNAGTYPIVPSVTGADLSDYTVTTTDGTLTITEALSSISLTASASTIAPFQPVTFTANVASSTTGTPTGTVTFYDGSTAIGTVNLNAGAASFTTSSLAPGETHTISAIYSGDINFMGSTTTANLGITVTPLEFTITINGATTQSVYPGGTVTYTFKVAPQYGIYAGPMSFQVSGLPSTATATFSPDSIPANGGPQTVTLTITDAALSSASSPPSNLPKRMAPFALALLLLPLAGARRLRKQSRRMRQMMWVMVLAASALSATILSGCGSKNGFFTQTPQNYSVTVTATAGDVQKTATVTLNVQ